MTKLASQKKKTTCVPKGKNDQSLKYKPKLKELRNQNMIAVIMKLTLTTLTKKVQLTHDVKLITVQKQMTKQWELNGFWIQCDSWMHTDCIPLETDFENTFICPRYRCSK